MAILYAQHRVFTVDEYYRMAEVGILSEDDRVELIDGEIIEMTPIGSRHAAAVSRTQDFLTRVLAGQALIRVQHPIRLDHVSEPEPDLAVVHPRSDFYAGAHPGPADVLLLVEVADSSVVYDRQVKAALYARFGIAELWIVDLTRDEVSVHTGPANGRYQEVHRFPRGGAWTSAALGGATVRVEDLIG